MIGTKKLLSKPDKALIEYVDAASEFVESVKRNLKKDGVIDHKTVLAMNRFVIAANEVEYLTKFLQQSKQPLN